MSCTIKICCSQNFYKVLGTGSAGRKDFFDTLKGGQRPPSALFLIGRVDDFHELLGLQRSAANEAAVARYLRDEIGFYDIPAAVERALTLPVMQNPTLDDILAIDAEARRIAAAL